MSNVERVGAIYAAFGQGDIPGILDSLADDVRWDMWEPSSEAQDGTIPYLVPRKGKEGVGEFFAAMTGLEFNGFAPLVIAGDGDTVLALISSDVTVKATGKRIQDHEVHVWTFDADGKVASLRHVVDTLKHHNANAR